MKAVLDHVGIAVEDIDEALAFYRDALGLRGRSAGGRRRPQRVRARMSSRWAVRRSNCSRRRRRTRPIATLHRASAGPGIHHVTLRVEDIRAALAQLKARGVRLVDAEPRPGAGGSLVAFIHPSAAHGVLVELKQARRLGRDGSTSSASPSATCS